MTTSYTHMSDIAYEQIQGKFWFGQYGDFNVVLDKESGYINVSKLCRDGGKKCKNWKRNNSSRELIAAFSLDVPEARILASQNDWLIKKIITQQHTEQKKLIRPWESMTRSGLGLDKLPWTLRERDVV